MIGSFKEIGYTTFKWFMMANGYIEAKEIEISSGTKLEIKPGVIITITNKNANLIYNLRVDASGHIEFDYNDEHYEHNPTESVEIILDNHVDFITEDNKIHHCDIAGDAPCDITSEI